MDYFLLGKDVGVKNILACLECLEWQVAMGADDACAMRPLDRFKEKTNEDNAKQERQNIAVVMGDSRKPTSGTNHGQATTDDNTDHNTPRAAPLGSFAAIEQATAMAKECKTLDDIVAALQQYEGCPLKNLARNMVFGAGVAQNPALMVIGDAPDDTEDKQGKPFVGPAGQLIKKALAAGGFSDDSNTYFTNSIYWKRPGSRAANNGEQKSCLPFLLKQIEIVAPQQLWVMGIGGALGFFDNTISKCRAQKKLQLKIGERSIAVMVSHAPDYYWQKSLEKKSLWQDILAIKASSPA